MLEEYYALIEQGAKAWNLWRSQNPSIKPILDGLALENKCLDGIDFSDLSMRNVSIHQCQMANSLFLSTNLKNSNLQNNNFSGARFIASCLDYADLSHCNFSRATLLTATVRGACLDYIDFRGHDLRSLDLRETSLANCNLEGQLFANMDLSAINFKSSNLNNADLSFANLAGSNLKNCDLINAKINSTNFNKCNLTAVNLSNRNLEKMNFSLAILKDCDFRESNLSDCNFSHSDLSGAKLWRVKNTHWKISHIQCEYAFWDQYAHEKTVYRKHEFERIYGEASTIELKYPVALMAGELATLPIFIEHLEATYWGTTVRLKEVQEIAGGALVRLVIRENGSYHPAELKNEMQEEANRIHQAQLALRNKFDLRKQLKEKMAEVKEYFWPRLLEMAAENESEKIRNLTIVFMDLKGFSKWKDDELSDKLSLFRGLLKPILKKWEATYPNMEGDSLRVTFRNATAGLQCACMMRDVLKAAGFEVRVGVELGEVTVLHNEVTDLSDLEGSAVIMASRLESIAIPGQVIVTDKVRHYTDSQGLFVYSSVNLTLNKSIGDKNPGDIIGCYSVDILKPMIEAVYAPLENQNNTQAEESF